MILRKIYQLLTRYLPVNSTQMTSSPKAHQLPLVVVLGATACGKSRLAIDLARRFGGEIIGADSMQVYQGLNIVTNKVTDEERSQAPHHMIDFLEPDQRYSVIDFREKALNIIDSLLNTNRLPILVGGTNYYIESIIWKNFILGNTDTSKASNKRNASQMDDCSDTPRSDCIQNSQTLLDAETIELSREPIESIHTEEDLKCIDKFFSKTIYHDSLKDVDSKKLWSILEQVDQKSAHIYHPSDRRKIIRCMQIIQRKKRGMTDILQDVNKSSESSQASLGGPLRYPKTCVFWISCDYGSLDKVLDDRVDQMIERGLLKELNDFHLKYNKSRVDAKKTSDYTKGIFQTIGFKEFHEYLILSREDRITEEGTQTLQKCIQAMKLSTRRYARRQFKWIDHRLMTLDRRDLPDLYKLHTSLDEQAWQTEVSEPAIKIVEHLIKNEPLDRELAELKQIPEKHYDASKPGKFFCEPCDRLFIGSRAIEAHLMSRKHEKSQRAFKRNKLDSPQG